MKTISVRQPYATLICAGVKRRLNKVKRKIDRLTIDKDGRYQQLVKEREELEVKLHR